MSRKKPDASISINGGPPVDFDAFKSRLQSAVHGYGISGVENHLLRAMAENGAKDLIAAIAENEPEILDDIARITENAGPDGKVKFKVSFGVTLDLQKSKVLTAFGYSVKRQVKNSHRIDPPEQGQIEFEAGAA